MRMCPAFLYSVQEHSYPHIQCQCLAARAGQSALGSQSQVEVDMSLKNKVIDFILSLVF